MSETMQAVFRRGTLVAALLATTLAPSSASARQLLDNWSFEEDVAGWSKLFDWGTIQHDPERDGDGYPESGSIEIVNDAAGVEGAAVVVQQCIDGPPQDASYFAGGRLRYRADETASGRLLLQIAAFEVPGCEGVVVASASSPYVFTSVGRGSWFPIWANTITGEGVALPADAVSYGLRILLVKDQVDGVLTANVDDLFLAPVDTPTCDGLPATMVGTAGDDLLVGTAGRDVIVGRGGDDEIRGRRGNDVLCGSAGRDRLLGQGGFDRLFGGAGGDELIGGARHDLLVGNGGPDTLRGGGGADDLIGGAGNDVCGGGGGGPDVALVCETVRGVP